MTDNHRRLIGLLVMLGALSIPMLRADDMPVEGLVAAWAPPPSELADLNGQLLHYRDEGPRDDPTPLLLLHGTASSLHTWDGWARALKTRRRVVRIDLPGYGLAGPWAGRYAEPGDGPGYRALAYLPFVLDVMDRLQLKQVVLVGHGLGGEVAWRLAEQAPQRVQRLVLVAAEGLQTTPTAQPLAAALARVPVLGRVGEWMLTRSLVRQGLATAVADPARITPSQVNRYYDLALRAGNRAALIQHLRDQPPGTGLAHVPRLALPTLVLWGGRDRLVPAEAAERFMADIPGSRLVRWDDLGHLPQEEDPARSVAALQQFLGWPAPAAPAASR